MEHILFTLIMLSKDFCGCESQSSWRFNARWILFQTTLFATERASKHRKLLKPRAILIKGTTYINIGAFLWVFADRSGYPASRERAQSSFIQNNHAALSRTTFSMTLFFFLSSLFPFITNVYLLSVSARRSRARDLGPRAKIYEWL